MPRVFSLLSCLLLALLASCAAPVVFSPPGNDWKSFQGQMHYANAAGRSVVGEVQARLSPGGDDFQFQFSSGPGFPLLKLWQAGDDARAEGAFARGSWHGKASSAGANLKNWLRLRDVFKQLSPGRDDLRGPGWTATAAYAAAEPQRCEIAFQEGGERFVFQFTR